MSVKVKRPLDGSARRIKRSSRKASDKKWKPITNSTAMAGCQSRSSP
jgi:hypothetical protein